MLLRFIQNFAASKTNITTINIQKMEIISHGQDKIYRRLIYNDSILSFDRLDSLSFHIVYANPNVDFNIIINFLDEGEKYQTKTEILNEGKDLVVTLFRWDSSNFIELIKPMEFTLKIGKKIWLRFATRTNTNISSRTFQISVWTENN
jgi:hypothetical protein